MNRVTMLFRTSLVLVIVFVARSSPAQLGGQQPGAFGGGGLGGGSGQAATGSFGGGAIARKSSAMDTLTRVITTTIAPDSWDEVGGAGSMYGVDQWGLLFVDQTEEVHEQIESLIAVIRKARAQLAGDTQPADDVPISMVVESPIQAGMRAKIDATLDQRLTLAFHETPLQEVVDFLIEHCDIMVHVDKRALEDVGLGTDTPVTSHLKDVSMRSALRITLRELELSYVIKEGLLQFTTPEVAENQLVTRVYLVPDLVIPPESR